ncbi:TPA: hypothetical protein EYP12_07990 [Candidatus Bipolaricaulota bacterium]|nr:hypothetical protein [Candidatus Bipolaricaulota bacterium]
MRYRGCYRFWGPGFGFTIGFPPFGFRFHGPRGFLKREEYLEMLEEYKRELEEELREVEKEIEEWKKAMP